MVILFSAAFIGFVHSLSPAHWLPIVLLGKVRKWQPGSVAMGSQITGLSHVLSTLTLAVVSILAGEKLLGQWQLKIETYSGLGLSAFGLAYAIIAYWNHYRCHGHGHHGPVPKGEKLKHPVGFLIAVGLAPCVAILPLLIAASAHGWHQLLFASVAFAVGVLGSLFFSTFVVTKGAIKLDHPFLEHYGDVITGLGVLATGLVMVWLES